MSRLASSYAHRAPGARLGEEDVPETLTQRLLMQSPQRLQQLYRYYKGGWGGWVVVWGAGGELKCVYVCVCVFTCRSNNSLHA